MVVNICPKTVDRKHFFAKVAPLCVMNQRFVGVCGGVFKGISGKKAAFCLDELKQRRRFCVVLSLKWICEHRGFTAHVAQLVERILGKDEVSGSTPLMGSITEE